MEFEETTKWTSGSVSVVVLGAGFSAAATDGKMPLMNNFFDCLDHDREPHLFECVSCVANNYKTANIERVLIALEQICTSPDDMLKGWGDIIKANLPLLRRELSLYMLRRLKQGLDIPHNNWAATWLANFGPKTTVISMNYDNIAERILSSVAHNAAHWPCPHCKMRALSLKKRVAATVAIKSLKSVIGAGP